MLDIFKRENVQIQFASDAHRPEDVGKNISEMRSALYNEFTVCQMEGAVTLFHCVTAPSCCPVFNGHGRQAEKTRIEIGTTGFGMLQGYNNGRRWKNKKSGEMENCERSSRILQGKF